MGEPSEAGAGWLAPEFWDRLKRLEVQHQKLQAEHEDARRRLERVTSREADELRAAWRDYCQVIADLDQNTSEFETLRSFKG